jgi:hypothetical protein
VCKIIKQHITDGYLEEVDEIFTLNGFVHKRKTKPILYSATDKIYPVDDKLTNSTSRTQGCYNNDTEDPRLNLICVIYPIIEIPAEAVPGHSWVNNNTVYVTHKERFECGEVTFRLINNQQLVIWKPEKVIDKRHIRNCTDKIYSQMQEYANWFQKRFRCKLGLPEIYQDYHLAFQENDPVLRDYVEKHGIIKVVDGEGRVIAWWDQSKGHPEFETSDERIAEARVFAPMKIIWLEDKMHSLENSIKDIKTAIVIEVVNEIKSSIVTDIKKEVSHLFENQRQPDSFKDVT